MIDRKRFAGLLGSGLIGMLFVNPFKDKEKWGWFRLYDFEGNFERFIQLDVTSVIREKPIPTGGDGYTHLVTPDGLYHAKGYRVVRLPERFQS